MCLCPTRLAYAARDCRWPPSQTKVELPDGRLQITLQLNNLVDIRTEIFRHGQDTSARVESSKTGQRTVGPSAHSTPPSNRLTECASRATFRG